MAERLLALLLLGLWICGSGIAHAQPGFTQTGIASYYGKDFHGRKTSNGEVYNMYALTAAHKTIPLNSLVRVTNLTNNLSVVVRINDHGPHKKDVSSICPAARRKKSA